MQILGLSRGVKPVVMQKPASQNVRREMPAPRFEGVGSRIGDFVVKHPLGSICMAAGSFLAATLGYVSHMENKDLQRADKQMQVFESHAREWNGKQEGRFLREQLGASYQVNPALQVWAVRQVLKSEAPPEEKIRIFVKGLSFDESAVSGAATTSLRQFLWSNELKNNQADRLLRTLLEHSPGYHFEYVSENVWVKRRDHFPEAYRKAERELAELLNKGQF